jgi:hypothetical protein
LGRAKHGRTKIIERRRRQGQPLGGGVVIGLCPALAILAA